MSAANDTLAVPRQVPFTPNNRPTAAGWILLLMALSLFASAIKSWRPTIAGLSIHPYVFVLVLAAPVAIFWKHPVHVRRSLDGWGLMLLIGVFLSFATNGVAGRSLPLLAKWGAMGVTFMVTTRLVRSEADYRLGLIGMTIAVAAIGLRGLFLHQFTPRSYVEVMPGIGSRNIYSFWTLAPIAFCVWVLATKGPSRRAKLITTALLAMMVVPQVLSLSRSGWVLIVATVGLVLAMKRSLRLVLPVLVIGFTVQWGISSYGSGKHVNSRIRDLQEGTTSDANRGRLIRGGLELFLDNPVFGVSQTKLQILLGRKLRFGPMASHNLIVDMLAGTGLLGLVPLLMCGLVILRRWWVLRKMGAGPAADAAGIIPVLLALILLRSMTADEIIYNPAVMISLALAYGAANVAIGERRAYARQMSARA